MNIKKSEIYADKIIEYLHSLDVKDGDSFEWIHHPKTFLPANVMCDFVGVTKFRQGIIDVLKGI